MPYNNPGENSYDPEVEAQIDALLEAIAALMPTCKGGWVSWRKLAKRMYGSEEFAISVSGLAQMEAYRHLFITSEHVVKLSEAGIKRLQHEKKPSRAASETQVIAEAVRQYAARLERIYLKIIRLASVARVGKKVVQAIFVDLGDQVLPSEAPVEIRPRFGRLVHGKIVGQENGGNVLYVALDWEVQPDDLPAVLSIDRGFLLYQLSENLRTLPDLPPLIAGMLKDTDHRGTSIADQDSLRAAAELHRLNGSWARFLWGPPGSGKTYAMGNLALRLLEHDPQARILLLAPSNRAVDVALEQFIGQLENSRRRDLLDERLILRYGYPRKPSIMERPELLGPQNLDKLTQNVKKISNRIVKAEKSEASAAELAVLHAELLTAQEEVKQAVVEHIRECRVVATTTTLAYLPSSPISKQLWENVLVDEVTMVTPAMCTFLASLAQRRFLLGGDPRQLGPVYEGRPGNTTDYEWLGRDIFDKSGISQGQGDRRQIRLNDARMTRITGQRRCAAEIWERVSYLYPEVANLSDPDARRELAALPPSPGAAVVLLDTSRSAPLAICERVNYSWQNKFTAELALEVALTIAAEAQKPPSIAIITPYRSQVRLLRDWLRQEQRAERSPYADLDIDTGTVHQFQGSDADVVIFDLVDGPGRGSLGALLTGDTGLRLVNVALTRAKGKFILIADKLWCERSFSYQDNPLLWKLVTGRAAGEVVQVDPPVDYRIQGSKGQSRITDRRRFVHSHVFLSRA